MKKFYPIMKTTEEVETFITRYTAEIESTYAGILKQLHQKSDAAEKEKYIEVVSTELNKIIGTCNSTMTYAIKHKCPLAENTEIMNRLKAIVSTTKSILQAVNRSAEYEKTSNIFASLAQGIIPSGYIASDVADLASETAESDASTTIAEPQEDTQSLD